MAIASASAPAARTTPPSRTAEHREPTTSSSTPAPILATRRICADSSSIYLGAAQVSAYRKGWAASPQDAANRHLFDLSVRLSSRGMLNVAAGYGYDRDLVHPYIVFSTPRGVPSPVEPIFARDGWHTAVRELNAVNREKGVDTTLSCQMIEDACFAAHAIDPTTVTISLFAGDSDYVDPVERLRRYGYTVEVLSWRHVLGRELRQAASHVIELDDYFSQVVFYTRAH